MPVVHYNSGIFYAWIDGVLTTIPIGGSSPSNGLNSPLIIEKEDESFEPFVPYLNIPNVNPIFVNWTPTLTFGGGSTGITYDLNAGRCVKIGRLVLTSGRIFLTNKGSSTGSALINGLPFTISAGSPFGSGTSVCKFLNMASINNWFSVLSEDGTTALSLWNGGTANTVTLTEINFTNTSDINFQSAYISVT